MRLKTLQDTVKRKEMCISCVDRVVNTHACFAFRGLKGTSGNWKQNKIYNRANYKNGLARL